MRRLLAGLTAIAATATVLVLSPAEAASRYAVTAFASTTKVDVGQSITLTGKVSPRARGEKVKVQRLSGSTWTTITKATLNRRSKYAATVRVTAPGDNRYRVVKPKSAGHKKGVSPTVTVVGWRWRTVASLPLSPLQSTFLTTELSSGILRGNSYPAFIRQGPDQGSAYYWLGGACTAFETVVGVTTGSSTANPASVFVFTSPMSDPESFDTASSNVEGVAQFRDPLFIKRGSDTMTGVAVLELRSSGIDPGDYVGWGNPRVYCRS